MTDIIFLLLIFFMLTSNLVQINVSLPKSESKTIAPSDLPVMLTVDGRVSVVGKPSSAASLEKDIATAVRKSNNKDNATVSIISEVLNLQLPGRKSKAPPSKAENKIIGVMKDGTYTLNSVPVSMSGIESTIRSLKQRDGEQAAFVVSPSGDADNESVVAILDLAWRMEIKAVLNDPQ
ncbi:MAG: biopolymer transporter ExbD [Saprospiraceae bacterium]|nr:biopolymer transporter ExbD [Saprospiraceae bacterium]